MRFRVWAVLVLCVCAVSMAMAQPSPEPLKVTPQAHAKAVELVRLLKVVPTMRRTINAAIELGKKNLPWPPKAQDDFVAEFKKELTDEVLEDFIVPLYEESLNEQDMDGILAFYKSPAGSKLLGMQDSMMAQAQARGRELGREIGSRVGRRIGKRIENGEYGPMPPSPNASPSDK